MKRSRSIWRETGSLNVFNIWVRNSTVVFILSSIFSSCVSYWLSGSDLMISLFQTKGRWRTPRTTESFLDSKLEEEKKDWAESWGNIKEGQKQLQQIWRLPKLLLGIVLNGHFSGTLLLITLPGWDWVVLNPQLSLSLPTWWGSSKTSLRYVSYCKTDVYLSGTSQYLALSGRDCTQLHSKLSSGQSRIKDPRDWVVGTYSWAW